MVINTKITIDGITYYDIIDLSISSSTSSNNASSSFNLVMKNNDGKYSSIFNIGDEIIIYADKNSSPATTKIFTGIIEEINFNGRSQTEKISLNGRDYSARLMDVSIPPEIYNATEVSVIVIDLITKYSNNITTNNVNVTTTTLNHISFNQIPLFDVIKQLAELSNSIFWVDENKDLHFEDKSINSSGITLNNTNIISTTFKISNREVYNSIWVYGNKNLSAYNEDFTTLGAATTGSVFTLSYKPHNTNVTVNDNSMRGGIYEMLYTNPSGIEYLINYDAQNIIFVSGTYAGDNIPVSGASIDVNYQRATPIIKFGRNINSISQYGEKTKIIVDKSIRDPILAEEIVKNKLVEFENPATQGNINIEGLATLQAGQTIIVDIPNYDINSVTYDILETKYNFNKLNCLSDNVLTLKVNKKIKDIADTLKQMMLDIKTLQAGDIIPSDVLSRLEYATGSVGIKVKNWEVKSRTTGSSFILGYAGTGSNPQAGGILGSVAISGINFLGDSRSSFSINKSGGEW